LLDDVGDLANLCFGLSIVQGFGEFIGGFLMDFWILMMQIYCKILDLQFLEYWCLNPLFDASL
jgi:hypothetical protein